MMEGSKALWLFLLLNHLPLCPADLDTDQTTTQVYSSTPTMETNLTTTEDKNSINSTYGNCLIDTEMGLIAIGSAGGLIVCLMVATVVLACQVCSLQRQVYVPRTSRSNTDLVSSAGYWGTDQPEMVGLVGPCDASVMLEEVRTDSKMDEGRQAEIPEAMEEAEAGLEEGATAMAYVPEEKQSQLQSSNSRDSCLEVPRDLENMPLVV